LSVVPVSNSHTKGEALDNTRMRTSSIRASPAPPTDALALSMAAGQRCDSLTSASGTQNIRENSEIRTKRLMPPMSCGERP